MFHDMRFTDMAKSSIGKDFVKITYKIKPKGMNMGMGKENGKPMDSEEEGGSQEELSSKLREAADLVDEGSYEEAMSLIEEASDMCAECCDSEGESEGESEMGMD